MNIFKSFRVDVNDTYGIDKLTFIDCKLFDITDGKIVRFSNGKKTKYIRIFYKPLLLNEYDINTKPIMQLYDEMLQLGYTTILNNKHLKYKNYEIENNQVLNQFTIL